VDGGANEVQPHYRQGMELQTHIDSRATFLVIVTLGLLLFQCSGFSFSVSLS
jgi:hypothetical protein